MINFEALYQISYGMFVVTSGDKTSGNGFISNTFFQVTSEPAKFASCCNKENYTAQIIKKTGCFSVSVLHTEASSDILGKFGYQSGRDINKLKGMDIKYGSTGTPIVLNDSMAYLELKVVEIFDVGTHYMFIGELVHSEIIDSGKEPMTYQFYRQVKKGLSPKNAPTFIDTSKFNEKKPEEYTKSFHCNVCGYVYDEAFESIKFEELSEDWTCPTCGVKKDEFTEIT